jgi:hypothetical protein
MEMRQEFGGRFVMILSGYSIGSIVQPMLHNMWSLTRLEPQHGAQVGSSGLSLVLG